MLLYPDQIENGLLAYNIFGFKLQKAEFVSRLGQHKLNSQLNAVAWRMYLIDTMRYRLRLSRPGFFFAPDFHSEYELSGQVFEEIKALQLYLLCTCIDTISGQDFVSFDEWLKIRKKGKKDQYGVDDEAISSILRNVSGDLRNPDIFRQTAAKLYSDVYSKKSGNRQSFVRQFSDLPEAAKKFLLEIYFISNMLNADPTAPQVVGEGIGYPAWDREYSDWLAMTESDKVNRIAGYFYKERRNLYTHDSASRQVQSSHNLSIGSHPDPFLKFVSTSDVIKKGEKYQIVAFRPVIDVDEVFVLRLIVSSAWLAKLGYDCEKSHFDELCWYQLRRRYAFDALTESEDIRERLMYYSEPSILNKGDLPLPRFFTSAVSRMRDYLYISTLNERHFDQEIASFIQVFDELNEEIDSYNSLCSSSIKVELADLRRKRAQVYKQVQEYIQANNLLSMASNILSGCSVTADRMWWPEQR